MFVSVLAPELYKGNSYSDNQALLLGMPEHRNF
jgi:hypothetical protein